MAREVNNLARKKRNLASDVKNLASDVSNVAREVNNVAGEVKNLARKVTNLESLLITGTQEYRCLMTKRLARPVHGDICTLKANQKRKFWNTSY